MINKSILKSKTFWVQVLAVLAVLFPPVQAWLASNPVTSVAALAAVNVLVRFVTSGRINILGDGGVVPVWLPFACLAAATAVVLPGCTTSQLAAARKIPIKACYLSPEGRVCYSNVDGLSAEVDGRK